MERDVMSRCCTCDSCKQAVRHCTSASFDIVHCVPDPASITMKSTGVHHLLLALTLALHFPQSISSKGSTRHLKDIVLGRCWDYHMLRQSNLRNCTAIWEVFHKSFAFKDPCTLTFADYGPFFEAVKGGDIVDKGLFWSGTYKAVHSYSDFDLRYTTLEDTFEGSMMNGLHWCGNASLPRSTSDGIDYQSCPSCDIITAFWGQASQKFAERTRGIIRVMVNGTRTGLGGQPIPAYSRSSFFGRYELPSFDVSTITKLVVIVVHTINHKELEKCGSGTIDQLVRDARSRGIKVVCIDDPDSVKHILCTDYPQSRECQFVSRNKPLTTKDNGFWKTFSIVLMITSSVLLITTVVMTTAWRKSHFKKIEDDTFVLT